VSAAVLTPKEQQLVANYRAMARNAKSALTLASMALRRSVLTPKERQLFATYRRRRRVTSSGE
jgi:hypothetical protein